jgi:hypothetical protein
MPIAGAAKNGCVRRGDMLRGLSRYPKPSAANVRPPGFSRGMMSHGNDQPFSNCNLDRE